MFFGLKDWFEIGCYDVPLSIKTSNNTYTLPNRPRFIEYTTLIHQGRTHWGQMTQICIRLPSLVQIIIWTNAGIFLIGPLGTNFNEFLVKIHQFSLKKNAFKDIVWKMAAILSGLQCVDMLRPPQQFPNSLTTVRIMLGSPGLGQ